MRFILTTILTLLVLSGCFSIPKSLNKSPKIATLTWEGYDGVGKNDPSNALYIFNGKKIGKGCEGFNDLIKEIRKLPFNSKILIYPDRYVLDLVRDMTGSEWTPISGIDPVPFRRILNQYQKLREIARERKLKIWYLAAAPGVCVWDNGEDIQIPETYDSND